MKPVLIKNIRLDFAKIEIYNDFLISQISEGLAFEEEHLQKFYAVFETYFQGRPFVSIADRKNDYTINPTLLRDARFSNLLGIGVVCYSKPSYNTAQFERQFYKGPFEAFYSMDKCLTWASQLVENHKKKADL